MAKFSGTASFELVYSSVAVALLNPLEAPLSIDQQDMLKFLHRPVGVGQTMDGSTTISSTRDRIEVAIGASKLEVREMSGEVAIASDKIPTVLVGFMGLLANPGLKSYGVNHVLDFHADDAVQLLTNKLFDRALVKKFSLTSGGAVLVLDKAPKKWTVKLDVRNTTDVNINLNASETVQKLPNTAQIGKEIREQYGELQSFLAETLGLLNVTS